MVVVLADTTADTTAVITVDASGDAAGDYLVTRGAIQLFL